jgi:hypothetical protein
MIDRPRNGAPLSVASLVRRKTSRTWMNGRAAMQIYRHEHPFPDPLVILAA